MVKMPTNPAYSSVIDMRRKPLLADHQTPSPHLAPHPQEEKGSIHRDILGSPQRVEVPWAELTASQVRALAKDMEEAWRRIEALTHREDLTPYEMLSRCRCALAEGSLRLPKRKGGRPQRRY